MLFYITLSFFFCTTPISWCVIYIIIIIITQDENREESEITQLAKVIEGFQNTFIPTALMTTIPTQYQAHLERIADFLLQGPGVWWK